MKEMVAPTVACVTQSLQHLVVRFQSVDLGLNSGVQHVHKKPHSDIGATSFVVVMSELGEYVMCKVHPHDVCLKVERKLIHLMMFMVFL